MKLKLINSHFLFQVLAWLVLLPTGHMHPAAWLNAYLACTVRVRTSHIVVIPPYAAATPSLVYCEAVAKYAMTPSYSKSTRPAAEGASAPCRTPRLRALSARLLLRLLS